MTTKFKARMAALEATVILEESVLSSRKITCEMDRNELRVIIGAEEKATPKAITFDITSAGGGSNVSHKEAWEKLQAYVPKALFKLPVIEVSKA